MNKFILQLFLFLAFIPLAILIGYGVLVIAPIFCCFLAINSYKFNNYKEMYIWMGIGGLSFILALYMLGVIWIHFLKVIYCWLVLLQLFWDFGACSQKILACIQFLDMLKGYFTCKFYKDYVRRFRCLWVYSYQVYIFFL